MGDLNRKVIYLDDAINALAENMPSTYTPDGSHPADEGIFMAQEIYADCIQTLKELPAVQPEDLRRVDVENILALLDGIRSSGRMEYYSDYCALHDAIAGLLPG